MAQTPGRRRWLAHSYGGARRSSWLELFFDLVFVVAVFRLGRLLVDHPSLRGVLAFAGLLTTMWWLWISFKQTGGGQVRGERNWRWCSAG